MLGVLLAIAVVAAVSVLAVLAITPQPDVEGTDVSQRAVNAEAARYTALGEYCAAQAEARQRAMDAYAARLTALAEYYLDNN